MICWKCQKPIDAPNKKVAFRSVCENCGWDLHVCKNCKFYMPGKPNDCNIPNTEPVKDRESFNFCEEFVFSDKKTVSSKSIDDIENSLFPNKDHANKPKKFKDLFKDD